jgi:hypothetical protein
MKQFIHMLFLFLVFGFLATAMITTIRQDDESLAYYENRTYAEMPALTAGNILSGDYFTKSEAYLGDHAAGRITLVTLKTKWDMNIFKRPVVNDIVISDDILLPWNDYETVDAASITKAANEVAADQGKLRDLIATYGGNYYYVAVPCQYAFYEENYPWYLNNRASYTALETDRFQQSMEAEQINYIDMGDIFATLPDKDLYSSKVDNHYSLYGAYETYRALIFSINQSTGDSLLFPDSNEITITSLPNRYLGSRNRKLLGLWNNDEKLDTATYTNPIPFTRMDNGKPNKPYVYLTPPTEWNDALYLLYMGGDIAETVIDTNRAELPSVLIYGDSFTNALETLIYYSFDEMRSLDLRYYDDMSLADYIETYQPDIVICVRDYEQMLNEEGNGNLFEKN